MSWGAFAGAAISALGAHSANKQTAQSIEDQMAFQMYMSNTAHQREVKDLIAAGLNPVLSAKYGGASTPSGASMTYSNEGANLNTDYASATAAKNQTKITKANVGLTNAQANLASNNSAVAQQTEEKVKQEIRQIDQNIKNQKTLNESQKVQLFLETMKQDVFKKNPQLILRLIQSEAFGKDIATALEGVHSLGKIMPKNWSLKQKTEGKPTYKQSGSRRRRNRGK